MLVTSTILHTDVTEDVSKTKHAARRPPRGRDVGEREQQCGKGRREQRRRVLD